MTHIQRGELKHNEPLAPYTSWCVGGPAKQIFFPENAQDLALFLQNLPTNERVLWLGLGSNVLVRDEGFNGTVILTMGGLKHAEIIDEKAHIVRVEAGMSCPTFARFCARASLTGAEFLAGVPGTIGGALRMNAGAFGGETWNHVLLVETIDRQGHLHLRKPNEFKVSYRSVKGQSNEWFIAGHFQLTPGDKDTSLEQIRQLLDKRAATQPTGQPSCGSVFRNPDGDYAARLIETAGLKGVRIGQALVSPKHANFIINEGNASARDIEALIHHVAEQVAECHGVYLHREVHIVGTDGIVE